MQGTKQQGRKHRKEGKEKRGNLPGQGSSEPRLNDKHWQEGAAEDEELQQGA